MCRLKVVVILCVCVVFMGGVIWFWNIVWLLWLWVLECGCWFFCWEVFRCVVVLGVLGWWWGVLVFGV